MRSSSPKAILRMTLRTSTKRWPGTLAEIKEQVKDEHEEVVELGGLYVLGTERHESRRIDNQLRGRSGRQGDPGESRFYLSLEDDLMRLFNTQLVARVMAKGMPEGEPIEAKSVSKGVRTAQRPWNPATSKSVRTCSSTMT